MKNLILILAVLVVGCSDRGDDGPTGVGLEGSTGLRGVQGVRGTEGPMGLVGPEGEEGTEGPEGLAGDDGEQGPAGFGAVRWVDSQGNAVPGIVGIGTASMFFDANGHIWRINALTGVINPGRLVDTHTYYRSDDCGVAGTPDAGPGTEGGYVLSSRWPLPREVFNHVGGDGAFEYVRSDDPNEYDVELCSYLTSSGQCSPMTAPSGCVFRKALLISELIIADPPPVIENAPFHMVPN